MPSVVELLKQHGFVARRRVDELREGPALPDLLRVKKFPRVGLLMW